MGVAHEIQSSWKVLPHCCCPNVLGARVQCLQAVSCNPLHALASLMPSGLLLRSYSLSLSLSLSLSHRVLLLVLDTVSNDEDEGAESDPKSLAGSLNSPNSSSTLTSWNSGTACEAMVYLSKTPSTNKSACSKHSSSSLQCSHFHQLLSLDLVHGALGCASVHVRALRGVPKLSCATYLPTTLDRHCAQPRNR